MPSPSLLRRLLLCCIAALGSRCSRSGCCQLSQAVYGSPAECRASCEDSRAIRLDRENTSNAYNGCLRLAGDT